MGGSVNAISFIKSEIEESAFGYHERYRTKQDIVVGVNKYEEEDAEVEEILRVDPESEREQVERLKAFKQNRDQELADKRLEELREAARGDENLMRPDPRRAQGLLLGRRGLRRDARRLRRVPARELVQEAELRETETGLVPEGEGWFVLNLRDASWDTMPGGGTWAASRPRASGSSSGSASTSCCPATRPAATTPSPTRRASSCSPASASSSSRARSGACASGTSSTARPGPRTSRSGRARSRARSS